MTREDIAVRVLVALVTHGGDPFNVDRGAYDRNIEDDCYTAAKYADALLVELAGKGSGGSPQARVAVTKSAQGWNASLWGAVIGAVGTGLMAVAGALRHAPHVAMAFSFASVFFVMLAWAWRTEP